MKHSNPLMRVKVYNMHTANGKIASAQFIIYTPTMIAFQSYDRVIAIKANGRVYLDADKWNISNTTSKYRNIFLGESTIETRRKIESGEYILCDLNRPMSVIYNNSRKQLDLFDV